MKIETIEVKIILTTSNNITTNDDIINSIINEVNEKENLVNSIKAHNEIIHKGAIEIMNKFMSRIMAQIQPLGLKHSTIYKSNKLSDLKYYMCNGGIRSNINSKLGHCKKNSGITISMHLDSEGIDISEKYPMLKYSLHNIKFRVTSYENFLRPKHYNFTTIEELLLEERELLKKLYVEQKSENQ